VVVLVVGTDLTWAAEGHDATSIVFNNGQKELILQVSQAAKKVILVLLTAVPLDLTSILINPYIDAVLHVGQPSVQTLGVGDLIFGKRVPAGRMIQTNLPASYAQQISIFDFNMRPGPSVWPRPDCSLQPPSRCPRGTNPGRTYRFYTGAPVVPFGFGLSYTTFSYSLINPNKNIVSLSPLRQILDLSAAEGRDFPSLRILSKPLVQYTVNVTNTGTRDADDVVLGFLIPPGSGQNGVPIKFLFGFERVHVPRGQTVTVFLYPTLNDFIQVDENGSKYPLAGKYGVHFGLPETLELGQGFADHFIHVE